MSTTGKRVDVVYIGNRENKSSRTNANLLFYNFPSGLKVCAFNVGWLACAKKSHKQQSLYWSREQHNSEEKFANCKVSEWNVKQQCERNPQQRNCPQPHRKEGKNWRKCGNCGVFNSAFRRSHQFIQPPRELSSSAQGG